MQTPITEWPPQFRFSYFGESSKLSSYLSKNSELLDVDDYFLAQEERGHSVFVTCLTLAAERGHLGCVRVLTKNGANNIPSMSFDDNQSSTAVTLPAQAARRGLHIITFLYLKANGY